jgi:hypothetical protein
MTVKSCRPALSAITMDITNLASPALRTLTETSRVIPLLNFLFAGISWHLGQHVKCRRSLDLVEAG